MDAMEPEDYAVEIEAEMRKRGLIEFGDNSTYELTPDDLVRVTVTRGQSRAVYLWQWVDDVARLARGCWFLRSGNRA